MTDQTTTPAQPQAVLSSAELGLLPIDTHDHPEPQTMVWSEIELRAIRAYAARCVATERQRCAKPVPDEWLVKVRRLVEGFEHVSGIARLWEPDYSTGSERALWARATEACADVAKLLAEAKKA